MTEQHLQEWIKHPEHLNEESLQELKELVGRYPYFQTARVLYLKNLFVSEGILPSRKNFAGVQFI